MDLKNKKFCFLGDSITFGVGTSCSEAMFPNLVGKETGASAVYNHGISGNRIARQSDGEDIGGCMADRFRDMEDDADVVVVFGGTNDYGHGDAPFGTPEDRTPDTFTGACHTLFAGLLEKYPDAVIVVMTPIHRMTEDEPSTGNGLPLSAYINTIRETAESYSIPVLDLYAGALIQPKLPVNRERFCPDGLHPNDAGNRRIADRLLHFLQAY